MKRSHCTERRTDNIPTADHQDVVVSSNVAYQAIRNNITEHTDIYENVTNTDNIPTADHQDVVVSSNVAYQAIRNNITEHTDIYENVTNTDIYELYENVTNEDDIYL